MCIYMFSFKISFEIELIQTNICRITMSVTSVAFVYRNIKYLKQCYAVLIFEINHLSSFHGRENFCHLTMSSLIIEENLFGIWKNWSSGLKFKKVRKMVLLNFAYKRSFHYIILKISRFAGKSNIKYNTRPINKIGNYILLFANQSKIF